MQADLESTGDRPDGQAGHPIIQRPAVRLMCMLIGTLGPLAIALGFAVQNFAYPTAVYQMHWSDHFSHMGGTLMFLTAGLDVYRKPANEILKPAPPDGPTALPEKFLVGPGFIDPLNPAAPAVAMNWPFSNRAYPPGVYVLYFPITMLYHFRVVGFVWACRIIILGFVLASAAINFLLLSDAVAAGDGWSLAIKIANTALISGWCYWWALQGEYDVTALLLVVVSLLALRRRAWIDAVFYVCLGAFLHSRVLYASPIGLIALAGAWREDRHFLWRWVRSVRLWIALGAITACLVSVVLVMHHTTWRFTNIYGHFGETGVNLGFMRALGIALGLVAAAAQICTRDFAGLLMLLCPWYFMLETPEAHLWHTIYWLPLLIFLTFNLRTPGRRFVWFAALMMVTYLGWVVYGVDYWLLA